MGKAYQDDPAIDESKLLIGAFSCLSWLEQFPNWRLTARFMPATPPPPGVATTSAAAMSEGKDPQKAITEARVKVGSPSHQSRYDERLSTRLQGIK